MSNTNELRAVKLTGLLERCEKATKPDRYLSADLYCGALNRRWPFHQTYHCTSHIDGALALLDHAMPGLDFEWFRDSQGSLNTVTLEAYPGRHFVGQHAVPAIAICIALLRALLSTSDARAPSVEEGRTHG